MEDSFEVLALLIFPSCFLSPKGSNYYVRILSTIDRELLKPNASVALHKHSNALVDVLPPEADSSIMMLTSGGGGGPGLGGQGGLKGIWGPGWEPWLCSLTRPEAGRDVCGHRGHGHSEAGGAGGSGAPTDALRALQAGAALGGARKGEAPLCLELVTGLPPLGLPPLCVSDRHRPSPRRPHVRAAWLREDHVGEGCGSSHDR